jgi:hypothetical protein
MNTSFKYLNLSTFMSTTVTLAPRPTALLSAAVPTIPAPTITI